jgi:RimJ/RimL family protein N-acetyltransferase
VRLDLDYEAGEALVSAIIGEADHRNRGTNTDIFVPLLAFLFDTLGLERVRASVLERNQVTLRYLLKLGWQTDATPEPRVRSQTDGTALDRCSISWTRDGFRNWLASPVGTRIRQRIVHFGG